MEDRTREVLKELAAEYGAGILEDTDRLVQFLEDRCTGSGADIFRLTFALRYLLKSGWNPHAAISERNAAIYTAGLVSGLGFTEQDAEDVVGTLRVIASAVEGMTEDEREGGGVVASAGNLRRIESGASSRPRTMWIRRKSMRNGLVLIAALAAIAVLFFQIGSQRNPVGDELRIAFLASLSGPDSQSGLNQLRAVQLAVENINRQGGVHGYKLKIVGFDLPSDPVSAEKYVSQIMKDKSILVAVSGVGGEAGRAICTAANENSIPLVIAAQNARITDSSGRPYLYAFSIASATGDRAKMMAYFIANGLNKMKSAVFYELGENFSAADHETLLSSVRHMGGEIVIDIGFVRRAGVDYTAPVKAIEENDAEVLILPRMDASIASVITAVRGAGFTEPIISENYTEDLTEAAGKALTNSWWVNEISSLDPQVRSVLSDFRSLYNESVPQKDVEGVMLAYDSIIWIAHAFYSASGYKGEAIRHAMLSTRNFPMTHATLTIDPRTHGPYNKAMAVVYCDSEKGIFQKRVRIVDSD